MPSAYSQVTRAPGARSNVPNRMAMTPSVETPRSKFDRSHTLKTTMDAGYLVPIMVDEVLPGDTFDLKTTMLARLATPVAPIMDSLYLETFYFFVPMRLVWDNFQKFMGEQANPADSTDYVIPIIDIAAPVPAAVGSIYDYMGIPPEVDAQPGETINCLPFRAYNRIYNEWFRDQNLQNSVPLSTGDGPDNPADFTLLRRGKRHDYFTSCLPWPQKGPGVNLPLGSTAPLVFTGNVPGATMQHWFGADGNNYPDDIEAWFNQEGTGTVIGSQSGLTPGNVDVTGTHHVDLSSATAATINSLRQAFQLQRMLERDARGGTRYIELLRSHFNVVSPDFRLQRTEYLGGGHADINIHPVPQTNSTDATSPQGNLAAMGLAVSANNGFNKSFTEHGYIIGLANVRADLTYQQGLHRLFSRRTKYDFYWPALAHLGEQAVLSREIYWGGGVAEDTTVFGYQERWAEYRYAPSRITGKMRSGIAGGSLDYWHLAQEFSARPVLNAAFIVDEPPVARVVAVPEEPHFIVDIYNRLTCARVMPTYSVPGLIDHF